MQTNADKRRQTQAKNDSEFEFSLIKVVQYTIPIEYQPTNADKRRQTQANAS